MQPRLFAQREFSRQVPATPLWQRSRPKTKRGTLLLVIWRASVVRWLGVVNQQLDAALRGARLTLLRSA